MEKLCEALCFVNEVAFFAYLCVTAFHSRCRGEASAALP